MGVDAFVDDALLDAWDVVNKIIQHQTLLESWMKGGFLNIAKARYVMGQQSVGANQLPAGERQVTARLLVQREDEPAEAGDRQEPPPAVYRVLRRSAEDADDGEAPSEPLRWFSALPPGALREAQRQFERALEIGCELATLKAELAALLAKMEHSEKGRVQTLTDAVDALSVS